MATYNENPDLENSIAEKKDITHNEFAGDGVYEPVEWNFTRVIAVAALCIAYVGSQVILYFVSSGLVYISQGINTNVGNWLLTANTLVVAGTCPFVGYMTDLLGRRWVTIVGAVLLIISSVVMATSHSLGSAITSMAIGGVGAAICELTAIAGVAEITPVKWRGVTLSLVTFSILPFIPQLTYMELLELHSTWRWAFGIAGIWNFIGFLGITFCYHPPPRHNTDGMSSMDILKQIDYLGAFLSFGGMTLLLVGLQAGGYQYPWSSGKVLGPLISGIILILAFPLWEWKGTKNPMVPGAIFRGQNVVAISLVVVFIAGMNFYAVLGFFPVMLTALYETNPLQVGYRGIGYPLAILIGACVVNALLSYTKGHIRQMFVVCALIMTAFGGALAAATPFNPNFAVVMATLCSLGIGAIIVPALTVALYACPDRYIGTTAALSLSSRFLGGSVGTAIYFNIFNTKIKSKLPTYVATAAVGAGLPAGSAMQFVGALLGPGGGGRAAAAIPGATTQVLQAAGLATRWAYADSLAYVWYTTIAFGVISIVCCAFLPNIRRFMTDRVAVNLH
ncbi:hypothetical protein VTL71DRAFT_4942 [Oculimacula yallundae]|uniref:Major facilitator superfamily (MFS) profile domain-containing protein n=1 Tax=Oculimacula yallundae TaxID=86028 RepID=A0ABR4C5S9_9HELO